MSAAGAKPRILHLHSTFDAGGKEVRCVRLINALSREAEHAIVSSDYEKRGAAKLLDRKANVSWPPFPSLNGKPWPRRLAKLAAAMQNYDLICTYNWGAMDAVLAHTLFADAFNLPPLIHHEDGFNEDEADGLKASRNFYRRIALGRTSALVVPSRTLETVALRAWHQPRSRVRRIPNGIATMDYAGKPKRDLLPGLVKRKGELWAGTLAGLRKVKNLPAMVRAFAGLPEEWQLVIAGEGPERGAIEEEARRLGIEDRVHLPGFTDAASLAPLFDIFVLSSQSEQFPISVLEAMAAGVPVAAPAVGDVSGMVAKENLPFIVAPEDEAALGAAMVALAADPVLRTKVGMANRAKAREEYEEAKMVERYKALYWSVMEQRAG
ncbi:glycosyltransferase [Altererythrobacter salegens]|uniref:Glycosyltransferase n=1 Tax=Croceibacterium salegens TaxID=1737568 RepID=A0A6I4STI3_9SPHN|nr:glycosyltransferase family 4 protein [Croceibacterium salegens]MXO58347.1 glycosyltransferase [Croceibacterium salegens]